MVILDEFQQFENLHTHTYAHPHTNLSSFFLKYSWFMMFCQSLLYSKVTQLYTFFFNVVLYYGLS